jgi:hypothetical protein
MDTLITRAVALLVCAASLDAQTGGIAWRPTVLPRGRIVTVRTIVRGPAIRGTVIAATDSSLELRLRDDTTRSFARSEIRQVTGRRERMSWSPLIGAAAGFGVGLVVFHHEDLVWWGTLVLAGAAAGLGALIGLLVYWGGRTDVLYEAPRR